MNNDKLQDKLREAIEATRPPGDDYKAILQKCEEKDERVIYMENLQKIENKSYVGAASKKARKWTKTIITSAAAVLLLVVGGIGYNNYVNQPYYVLGLDVNPSFSVSVSKNEEIIAIDALNEDALIVLNSMDLVGTNLDVGMNALVGAMVQNGYMTAEANTVLLTVEGENLDPAVETQLMDRVNSLFTQSALETSVLYQEINPSKELEEFAQENGISVGKANLINGILASDGTMTLEDLLPLSINELNLLTVEGNKSFGAEVDSIGTPNSSAFIGAEAALNSAFNHVGVGSDVATQSEVELDSEDGRMVYDIEVVINGIESEFEVDAKTGEIISYDAEESVDDDGTQEAIVEPAPVVTPQPAPQPQVYDDDDDYDYDDDDDDDDDDGDDD